MEVPNEKLPVCLISYLGQDQGNRTLKVPGTTVHLGRASKPAGPNTYESQAGLESTAVDADPPLVRGRLSGSKAYNRSTYFHHRGSRGGQVGKVFPGTWEIQLRWKSERLILAKKLANPSGAKEPHFWTLLKKLKIGRLTL